MSNSALAPKPLQIVEVVSEVPGAPWPLSYLWQHESLGLARVGLVVKIPLRGMKVVGWVVGVSNTTQYQGALEEVISVVGLGPTPSLVRWCLSYAAHLLCSPVYLLRHSSPKIKTKLSQRLHEGEFVDPSPIDAPLFVPTLSSLARQNTLIWCPPDGSSVEEAVRLAKEFSTKQLSSVIVAPTQSRVDRLIQRLRGEGLVALRSATQYQQIRDSRSPVVVVGSRGAIFAPREDLGGLVVIDHEDPALRESSAPYFESYDAALHRANFEGIHCVFLSSAPRAEAVVVSNHVRPFGVRADRAWSRVVVPADPPTQALSETLPRLWSQVADLSYPSGARICAGLVVIYNKSGFIRRLVCRACRDEPRCEACGELLGGVTGGARDSETIPSALLRARNVVTNLQCFACGERYPLRCLHCGSVDIVATSKGVTKIAAELSGILGGEVVEAGRANSLERGSYDVVVGTESLLYDDIAALGVVFLDFDQLFFPVTLDVKLHALYLLSRALESTAVANGRVVCLTRRPHNAVLEAVKERSARTLYADELTSRKRFGLPPTKSFILVSGKGASDLIANGFQELTDPDVEVSEGTNGEYLISVADLAQLPRRFREAAMVSVASRVRIEMFPRSL